jgi:diguanylate cyclase (GGDEF)-like protein
LKEKLAHDLLNALNLQVAVLDLDGTIVAVNDEWKRFARENGGDGENAYLGTNYLTVCERGACEREEGAHAAFAGMRALIENAKDHFEAEYPCHSPTEQRWFLLRMARFLHEGSTYIATTHEDITSRKLAEQKLREAEATLREVLENLPVGVWVMDGQGRIVHGNPASRQIWAGARYIGPEQFGEYKAWRQDNGQPITPEQWAGARAIRKGETTLEEEIRIQCFDGSSKIILNSAIPLRDEVGRINGAIMVNQDITSRKRVEEQLRDANLAVDAVNRRLQQVLRQERLNARTDELTGLSNRRHFFEMSRRLFNVAQRYGTPLSVLMFDIDHFKQINDQYGHPRGDLVLKQVARIAGERIRDADLIARYGGEEFIVIMPNTGLEEAYVAAEHIREGVALCHDIDGVRGLMVTISIGIAQLAPGETLRQLIHRADQALYAAKAAGRNRSRLSLQAA